MADFFDRLVAYRPLQTGQDKTVDLGGGCYLTQKELTYKTINKLKRFVPASKPNSERKKKMQKQASLISEEIHVDI